MALRWLCDVTQNQKPKTKTCVYGLPAATQSPHLLCYPVGMREKVFRLLKFVSIGIVAGVLAGALAGWVVAQFLHVPQVDALETFRPATASHVYADDGGELASWAVEQRVELEPHL